VGSPLESLNGEERGEEGDVEDLVEGIWEEDTRWGTGKAGWEEGEEEENDWREGKVLEAGVGIWNGVNGWESCLNHASRTMMSIVFLSFFFVDSVY
jgi:hypothetical protein